MQLRDKSTPMGTVNTILSPLEKHVLNRIEKGYKDKHMAVPARLRTTKLLANSAHFSACQILPSSFTFQAFRRGETVSGFASSLVGGGRVSVRPVRPVVSGQKRYAERDSDSDREEPIDLLSGSDGNESRSDDGGEGFGVYMRSGSSGGGGHSQLAIGGVGGTLGAVLGGSSSCCKTSPPISGGLL